MDKSDGSKKQDGVIIVRLLGGLGNQLFQYAFGRQLAVVHNKVLKLDLNFYQLPQSKWAVRTYDLNHFKIQFQPATAQELAPFQKYLKQNFFSKILRRLNFLGQQSWRPYYFEPLGKNFTFNPRLFTARLPSIVYFDGYWQSEKYFINIEDIIRNEFEFIESPDAHNQALLEEIESCNSVAVHIRHGDNATKIAAHHGVLPIGYYNSAIKQILDQVPDPNFYVFSDDPVWAKENLKTDSPVNFVEHNGEARHHEDLRLMSRCKHHIIGNSTFSWWGAWLGKKPGQLVYAPKRYHMQSNIDMADYYPKSWIQL